MQTTREVKLKIEDLRERKEHLGRCLDLAGRKERLVKLDQVSADPDLWDDQERAQKVLRERSNLTAFVERFQKVQGGIDDAEALLELSDGGELDSDMLSDVSVELASAEKLVEQMEFERMLGGEADRNSAIVTVNAGAGGTESCDWASMLLRMLLYYCEKRGWKTTMNDFQDGEEAGIKSAIFSVEGEYAYGYLKAEVGVHRLVRVSPFDSQARRHTSFASVFVSPEVDDNIEIELNESDIRVDTYRASGAGGQHVNKTDSAVRMTHMPTGIVVACQNERSQHKNRATAIKMLKSRLYELELQKRREKTDQINSQKKEISFGSQIRSYVLHPYRMVKDVRTGVEVGDVDSVLNGRLDDFIEAYLLQSGHEGTTQHEDLDV
ncbi:MAG: peptide chain release factor 2 [Myxococcales bacterium]|nr:peptide chain release factor 2 [Myxococcales bacterium]